MYQLVVHVGGGVGHRGGVGYESSESVKSSRVSRVEWLYVAETARKQQRPNSSATIRYYTTY